MTHAPSVPKPKPKPVRGKKLFVAVIVLFAGAIIGHAVWAAVEKQGVNRRVAAIRAAGEPIMPLDFAATNPAAPDNGGPDILAAGDAIEAYGKSKKDFAMLEAALPLRPEERKVIEAALADLATPLADVDRALNKARHEWDLDLTQSPVLINVMLPSMKGTRSLCTLQRDAALLEHANGDDAAAMRRLDDILLVARFTDRHPSLVGHLVAIGCTAMAADAIFQIAPDLKIGASAGNVSPEALRKMIDTLLDDELSRQGLRRALQGERMAQLDAVQSLMRGIAVQTSPGKPTRYNPTARYLFAPFFHRNSRIMLDRMTTLSALADEPDLPSVTAKLPPPHPRGNVMNLMADILLPAIERVFQTHHRLTSDRRLAATVLAIRLYQLDHAGRRPDKLADLVPKYLPSVPHDALIGKPLGYLPRDPRPRLYSAGENHVDDGGSDALIRPYGDRTIGQRGEEWGTLDRCVFLDLQPRPAPPPPYPANGDEGAAAAPTETESAQ